MCPTTLLEVPLLANYQKGKFGPEFKENIGQSFLRNGLRE